MNESKIKGLHPCNKAMLHISAVKAYEDLKAKLEPSDKDGVCDGKFIACLIRHGYAEKGETINLAYLERLISLLKEA